MKTQMLFILAVTIFLCSCSKADSSRACDLNNTSFAGSYKVTSVIYKYSPTDPGTDYFLTWPDCEKDDLQIMTPDHVIQYVDAGVLCPSGLGTSTWALSGNTIVMGIQSGTVTYFDCKTVSIIFPQTTPNETITLNLVRQ